MQPKGGIILLTPDINVDTDENSYVTEVAKDDDVDATTTVATASAFFRSPWLPIFQTKKNKHASGLFRRASVTSSFWTLHYYST